MCAAPSDALIIHWGGRGGKKGLCMTALAKLNGDAHPRVKAKPPIRRGVMDETPISQLQALDSGQRPMTPRMTRLTEELAAETGDSETHQLARRLVARAEAEATDDQQQSAYVPGRPPTECEPQSAIWAGTLGVIRWVDGEPCVVVDHDGTLAPLTPAQLAECQRRPSWRDDWARGGLAGTGPELTPTPDSLAVVVATSYRLSLRHDVYFRGGRLAEIREPNEPPKAIVLPAGSTVIVPLAETALKLKIADSICWHDRKTVQRENYRGESADHEITVPRAQPR